MKKFAIVHPNTKQWLGHQTFRSIGGLCWSFTNLKTDCRKYASLQAAQRAVTKFQSQLDKTYGTNSVIVKAVEI